MIVNPSSTRLSVLCALSAAVGLALWLGLAVLRAGIFEYPLDDVYIHLSMAEGIARGTYGINPGEPASAASSVLYPLLLLPFPGSEFQRFLPLFWNVAALLALAWTFGSWIAKCGITGPTATFLALIAPFALNMPGVAALGMEHTLHAVSALVAVIGLWRFLEDGRIGAPLIGAVILGPMLRFEGLAISLLAAAVLVIHGRVRAGALICVAAVLPVLLFALFLVSQGLEPIPSSVLVKTAARNGPIDPVLIILRNLHEVGAATVFSTALGLTAITALPVVSADRKRQQLLFVVWIAVVAHLCAGRIGWGARYELYFMVMMGAAFVLVLPLLGRKLYISVISGAVALAGYYTQVAVHTYSWSARSVHLQQAQMARLIHLLPGEPVAVNDIGWPSWRNDAYVLDLWGLAAPEARDLRLRSGRGDPVGEWAARLAAERGIRYAMIYEHWIREGIGSHWLAVATLKLDGRAGLVGGDTVKISATDPAFEAPLRAALRELKRELPSGAILTELDG